MNYKKQREELIKHLENTLAPHIPALKKLPCEDIRAIQQALAFYTQFFYKLHLIDTTIFFNAAHSEQKQYELMHFIFADTLRAVNEYKNQIEITALGTQPVINNYLLPRAVALLSPLKETLEKVLNISKNNINQANCVWLNYKAEYETVFRKFDNIANQMCEEKFIAEFNKHTASVHKKQEMVLKPVLNKHLNLQVKKADNRYAFNSVRKGKCYLIDKKNQAVSANNIHLYY